VRPIRRFVPPLGGVDLSPLVLIVLLQVLLIPLAHLRGLLRRGRFSFDEAVRGADRTTVAVTLFALLELYKRGEADWQQRESFGDIAVQPRSGRAPAGAAARVERMAG